MDCYNFKLYSFEVGAFWGHCVYFNAYLFNEFSELYVVPP